MAEVGVFDSYEIGQVQLKNRFFMAPMAVTKVDEKGADTQEAIAFYQKIAAGGVGLIITGVTDVNGSVEEKPLNSSPLNDPAAFVDKGRKLTKVIHYFDCKVFGQLAAGAPEISLKNIAEVCNRMSTETIRDLTENFGRAAVIFKDSGFDGIEVSLSGLLEAFSLSLFNQRKDQYGGSLKNRLRIVVGIIKEIKARCGEGYPVLVRLSVKSFIKDEYAEALPDEIFEEMGRGLPEAILAAQLLEKSGCDGFDLNAGLSILEDQSYWQRPPAYFAKGPYSYFAKAVKKVVKLPVLVAGKMNDPNLVRQALKEKWLDGVGLARPLLADPDYPNKLIAGRIQEIRPCLFCNDCLRFKTKTNRPLCTVNPECSLRTDSIITNKNDRSLSAAPKKKMSAFETQVSLVQIKKRIVVVGGGPAGLEAARVSVLDGHQVILYENSNRLGGKLKFASKRILRTEEAALISWYEFQLNKLGVVLKLNEEATVDKIIAEKPDYVLLAQGSEAMPAVFDGMASEKITNSIDVISDKTYVGPRCLLVGGSVAGCEAVLHLAMHRHKMTIVTKDKDILMAEMPQVNRKMLKDLLKKYKVAILTEAILEAVTATGANLLVKGKMVDIPAHHVMMDLGEKPVDSLYDHLTEVGLRVDKIGDNLELGGIRGAIWSGYAAAVRLR